MSPSPSRSPTLTSRGPFVTGTGVWGVKTPWPLPNRTETLSLM
jgi:hypothetical protein